MRYVLAWVITLWSVGLSAQVIENGKTQISWPDTLNVKLFGAKGDGKTNDYEAFRKVVELINERKHGVMLLPEGVYKLDVFNSGIKGEPLRDLRFSGCNGVSVIGENATISVKGDLDRKTDRTSKRFAFSNRSQIVPLYFHRCTDILVQGLKLDGNVQDMRRDKGVVEKGQGLIMLMGCVNIRIENVEANNSGSDGIYIGAVKGNSSNLIMRNVVCRGNARQGLSVTGLRNAQITGCTFSDTGVTGEYGFHRPAAGVDIEPVKLHGPVKTGNIVFEDCAFENNVGGQFICTRPSLTSNITIRKSKFKGNDTFSRYEVILAADSVLVEDCEFDLGEGNIFPTWAAAPGSRTTIQRSIIKSSLQGVLSASKDSRDSVVIRHNKFIFTGKTLTSYFPYLKTQTLYFDDNEVYIPSSSIGKRRFTSLVQNAKRSQRNRFYSDSETAKPTVSYQGTTRVDDR